MSAPTKPKKKRPADGYQPKTAADVTPAPEKGWRPRGAVISAWAMLALAALSAFVAYSLIRSDFNNVGEKYDGLGTMIGWPVLVNAIVASAMLASFLRLGGRIYFWVGLTTAVFTAAWASQLVNPV